MTNGASVFGDWKTHGDYTSSPPQGEKGVPYRLLDQRNLEVHLLSRKPLLFFFSLN